MDDKSKKDLPSIQLPDLLKVLATSNKKDRVVSEDELPTVVEVLERKMRPGTIMIYQEKDVVFKNSSQSAVKSLKVNIVSTEFKEMAVLHQLHTQTRSV